MLRLVAKRELTSLLAAMLLLANALWLGHLYHDHELDHEESCEICFVSHAFGKVVIADGMQQLPRLCLFYATETSFSSIRFGKVTAYLTRAPPFFS
jgi:hypothetical protein